MNWLTQLFSFENIKGGTELLVDTAIKGWEGKLQDVIANYGLGTIEKITQKILPEFKMGIDDFTVFGSIKYWDEILGKMKDANQRLGIAGNLGVNLQSSFREAYPMVVNMGITAEEMAKSVESFYEKTARARILSSNQMAEMSKMVKVLGEDSMEIVTTYGQMGLSITSATSRMRNLIVQSDKFGVLPVKVSGILKNNIDKVNSYNFKNGVSALEKMAMYAAKTNTDMKGAFAMADKLLEGSIEGAMEMSTNLQLIGGSVGNMGDMAELMYIARNEPEKFQEMFEKAAAGMGELNEQTGEIKFNAEARQRLKAIAQATGQDFNDLIKQGQNLKKSMSIGEDLDSSLKGLSNYEELLTKVSGAAEKNKLGEWVVKLKQDGKEVETAVSALTQDQIKQISFTDETTGPEAAFEKIATSNERLAETMQRLIETIKTEALSTAGYEKFSEVARTAADNIKTLAAPLIKGFQDLNKAAIDNVMSVIDPLSKGNVGDALSAAKDNLTGAVSKAYEVGAYVLKDLGTILYNVFTNAAKYLAAGIEWGFRNSIGALQRGIVVIWERLTGISTGLEVKDSFVEFSEVIGKYNIKPIFEGVKTVEDVNKFLNSNTTTTSTTPNVENKPVPETKTVPDDKKLTSTEDNKTKKVEVEFKNGLSINVLGNSTLLSEGNVIEEKVKQIFRVDSYFKGE